MPRRAPFIYYDIKIDLTQRIYITMSGRICKNVKSIKSFSKFLAIIIFQLERYARSSAHLCIQLYSPLYHFCLNSKTIYLATFSPSRIFLVPHLRMPLLKKPRQPYISFILQPIPQIYPSKFNFHFFQIRCVQISWRLLYL